MPLVSSRSLCSGGDTDMSATRGHYADDLIREARELERYRGGVSREGFSGVRWGSLYWTLKNKQRFIE